MKHVTCYNFCFGLILGCILCFPGMVSAQPVPGDSWAQVSKQKKGDITVYYYPENGFAYTSEEGNLEGLEIAIFRQFANYLRNSRGIHLDIHFVKQPNFDQLLSDVRNSSGGVFGAGNITITSNRERSFRFTPEYLPNVSLMITGDQTPGVQNLSDLGTKYKNLSAVVYRGTTNAKLVRHIRQEYNPDLKIEYVNSDEEALQKVIQNPHLFTYVDLDVYWMATRNHMKIKRQPAGDQKSGDIGFVMPRNSDWYIPFHKFFNIGDGYRSNPAYRSILVSYLGVNMTHMLQMVNADNR